MTVKFSHHIASNLLFETIISLVYLFVCLEFFVALDLLHYLETSTFLEKGCKYSTCSALMTVAQLGFFSALHLLFKTVIPEDPWHSHLMPSVWQWSCHNLFNDLGLSQLRFEHASLRREHSNPLYGERLQNKTLLLKSLHICCC